MAAAEKLHYWLAGGNISLAVELLLVAIQLCSLASRSAHCRFEGAVNMSVFISLQFAHAVLS